MDPSEFEDTVEKSSNILDAGALETLLHGDTDKLRSSVVFNPFDVLKEAEDIYLAIYKIQECLNKFPQYFSMNDFIVKFDDNAVRIAELKEEYLQRRKKLTAIVKRFIQDSLGTQESETLNLPVDDTYVRELKSSCKDLIETFKTEYDHLSSFAKFSEAAFIDVFQTTRDFLPDCKHSAEHSLQICMSFQDLLKRVQEQFLIAESLLTAQAQQASDGKDNSASTISLSGMMLLGDGDKLQRLKEENERELESLRQQHASDLLELKSRYEFEAQSQTMTLQESFEQRLVTLQRQSDEVVSSKESEIASLMHTIQDLQTRALEWEERSQMLASEYQKRQLAEDKLRQAMLDSSESNSLQASLSKQIDALQSEMTELRKEKEQELRLLKQSVEEYELAGQELKKRLEAQARLLETSPPQNLSDFAEKIGFFNAETADEKENGVLVREGSSGSAVPWVMIEAFVCERIRKLDSEVISLRLRDQERSKDYRQLQSQLEDIRKRCREKEAEVSSLEIDLLQAHEALQTKKALQSPQVNRYLPANRKRGGAVPAMQRDKEADDLAEILLGDDAPVRALTFSSIQQSDLKTVDTSDGNDDIESSSASQVQSISHAIQSQRDRYMRAAKELEQENGILKMKAEQLQEEQLQLRNENLELYRRLRILRHSSLGGGGGAASASASGGKKGQHAGASSAGSSSSAGNSHLIRSRKAIANELVASLDEEASLDVYASDDALDRRYRDLYEQQDLSPFRIAELEKQQYLSRMNVFDRMLAFIYRFVMHDNWTRHAFVVYLVLVHIFALMYVFQVLNPQLIEEVDAHLRAKWSMEAMSQPEHPDV